jgi:SET domain-containing protein
LKDIKEGEELTLSYTFYTVIQEPDEMEALKKENEELKANLARAKEDHQFDNLVHQKELESMRKK